MDDLERSILESVLSVVNDASARVDDPSEVRVPIGGIMDKLVQEHGYEDGREPQFYQRVADYLDEKRGEYWKHYGGTGNDGLPSNPLRVGANEEERIRSVLKRQS